MRKAAPQFIVVEGPVGVGKTTLAQRLAMTFNVDLMLENVADNPFLPRFYEDPKAVALATQLYFLCQRARLINPLKQADMFKPAKVADFLIQKDQLFAGVTLNAQELDLYYQVYNHMMLEAPVPDLVIYLQAPTAVLMERIYGSEVEYVKHISEEYVQRIADAYVAFFYHYHDSPLLIVNTADFNLAAGADDYNMLLGHISDIGPGRHYFNP